MCEAIIIIADLLTELSMHLGVVKGVPTRLPFIIV